MEKTELKLPKLQHRQDTFKIIIPDRVEEKIRFLCRNIWDVEWSGVLFYKTEGSFEDKSLVIRCIDIFQMDIGTGGYTEFTMSPDVAAYMVEHPELMEAGVYQGLIHSHNQMSTFFSGTDTDTLLEEGLDSAHFVSLIVNNAGNYTAGITRRYQCKAQLIEKIAYPTWGGETKEEERSTFEESEEVEWYNLIPVLESPFINEMTERMNAIKATKKIKEEEERKRVSKNSSMFPYYEEGRFYPFQKTEKPDDAKLEHEDAAPVDTEGGREGEEYDIPYGKVNADRDVVMSIVKQIVTTSVIVSNKSNVDLAKWANSMKTLYDERFHNLEEFKSFASNYLDFLMYYTPVDSLLEAVDNDDSVAVAILAYDVIDELKNLPANPYLKIYIQLLNEFII